MTDPERVASVEPALPRTSHTRLPQDSYRTPVWCIDALWPHIEFGLAHTFLEPCRGDGRIYDRVPVENKHWAEITAGRDYLDTHFDPVDLIITNPPFSLALEFLRKSLKEGGTVIYLLRLNFLASKRRQAFWKANPPDHLLVLSQRPSFVNGGTDKTDYAWFVWDRAGLVNGSGAFEFLL